MLKWRVAKMFYKQDALTFSSIRWKAVLQSQKSLLYESP
jgi:hypothetical protein